MDTNAEEKKILGCGIEFPHFGADYPDAQCIDGYLWNMDSYDDADGCLHIGGDEPCPVCNTEEWIDFVMKDKLFESRESALTYVEYLKKKYGN